MPATNRKFVWMVSAVALVLLGIVSLSPRSSPTVDLAATPKTAAYGWNIGQPAIYENLSIFPILAPQDADTSEFETLDAALASGDAVVTEQGDYLRRTRDGYIPPQFSNNARVNQLVLINRGKKPLILLAGEVVSGGKQDRIIGKDRIVPTGTAPLPLDVFCVEHGRWTGTSDQFSAGNLMVHPSVREEAAVEQDQKQVWAAVRGEASGVAGGVGVTSDTATVTTESRVAAPPALTQQDLSAAASSAGTQSYQKIYKVSPIGTSVENVAEEMSRRFDRATSGLKGERLVGVVVAFGDEVAWSDIFASSELFDAYWPKLLRSYVVEAMTRPRYRQTATVDDVRDFLRPVTGRVQEESEPGIYNWREQSLGELTEIQLEALAPKPLTLHYLRVLRGARPMFVE
jgi:hypothetical protein